MKRLCMFVGAVISMILMLTVAQVPADLEWWRIILGGALGGATLLFMERT